MEKVSFGHGHTYANEFKKFVDSKLFNRLKEKYRIKPYHEEHQRLKVVVLVSSYLFNILSITTGFFFAYILLISFLHPAIAILGSLSVLISLEAFKRLILPSLFKGFYQFEVIKKPLVVLSFCLVALSAFLSFNGGNTAVHEFSKVDVLDTTTTIIVGTIADRIEQQKQLSKVKYKGTTTRTAQKAISAIQDEINELRRQESKQITTKEQRETAKQHVDSYYGLVLSLLALIFDLSLIFCLWYLEYYDYRSLAEFAMLDDGDTAETRQNISLTGGGASEVITNDSKQIATTAKNNCLNCSKPFELTAPNKKFCSTKCRVKHWESKNKKTLSVPTI